MHRCEVLLESSDPAVWLAVDVHIAKTQQELDELLHRLDWIPVYNKKKGQDGKL